MHKVVKIAVIESERGWGRKIDDWMVCLSAADAETFRTEFNSKNTSITVPDWYMQVEGEPVEFRINDKQYKYLLADNRVWLSELRKL